MNGTVSIMPNLKKDEPGGVPSPPLLLVEDEIGVTAGVEV